MNLGKIIGRAREPKFKTKKSLADAAGVTLEYIRRIELGLSFPSGEVLERLISLTDMSPEDAERCWSLLAEHQLDSVTAKYVRLHGSRAKKLDSRAGQIARVVLDWAAATYDVTDEDRLLLEEKIKKLLKE